MFDSLARGFRYKLHADGVHRLQMVRYESVELTVIPEDKIIQSLSKEGMTICEMRSSPAKRQAPPRARKERAKKKATTTTTKKARKPKRAQPDRSVDGPLHQTTNLSTVQPSAVVDEAQYNLEMLGEVALGFNSHVSDASNHTSFREAFAYQRAVSRRESANQIIASQTIDQSNGVLGRPASNAMPQASTGHFSSNEISALSPSDGDGSTNEIAPLTRVDFSSTNQIAPLTIVDFTATNQIVPLTNAAFPTTNDTVPLTNVDFTSTNHIGENSASANQMSRRSPRKRYTPRKYCADSDFLLSPVKRSRLFHS